MTPKITHIPEVSKQFFRQVQRMLDPVQFAHCWRVVLLIARLTGRRSLSRFTAATQRRRTRQPYALPMRFPWLADDGLCLLREATRVGRPASAGGLGLLEQGLQFLHDLRLFEVKISCLAGVGFKVVELARCPGGGVREHQGSETRIVFVSVAAGAGVVDVFPGAAADREGACSAECLV